MNARLSGFVAVAAFLAVGAAPPAAEVWWSFRPLQLPPIPKPADADWARTPVDAFVLAKLREKRLAPAPEADRRTLIRRVTFDLTGLPPTPEEVVAFLADKSPDAYERLVDRLLASPAYGERWARHWLDAAHYADTHGHDQDRIRPNAWRYRDYLIAAFNSDKPYSRFVQEQLAADLLFPDGPALIPALGFLAAGPWDESSLRDIREDSIDRQAGYYLDRDDMVTTVVNTFQSLTVHCARCHDHKFDPIPQADYYGLQAVFAGVDRADRAFDPDPATFRKRRELRDTLASLDRKDSALFTRLGSPEFRGELTRWEARQPSDRACWTALTPVGLASANGATLTPMPDGSVRSEGKRPETDTYTVTVRSKAKGVTAVRLEVLADDPLPHRGPGRQDNGNLHLSEFRLSVTGRDGKQRPVALRNPVADYDQPGWIIRHAIDGNPKTAWGIYPQVGRDHEAIFELETPLGDGDEQELTFRLDQLHGGGHLIGRFRVSATTAPPPLRPTRLPAAVADLLAVPAEKRTVGQWQKLAAHYLREKISAELSSLPPPALVYAAAQDFAPDGGHKPSPVPRPVHVLKRGDIRKPGPLAQPGALSCLPGVSGRLDVPDSAPEGERRAALARWVTRPDNPLTWRSIVNRVWHHHFGRGLVDTPNDFGRMGGRPSHPELLDWLAVTFRDGGGSLKQLHRLIVTSAVYRQSSRGSPAQDAIDADNRLLAHFPRARLEAEQVRDAVLLVSGRLDRTTGGPPDQQFGMKPGRHVTPTVEYGAFDWDRPKGHRRSVYRLIFRTLPDPFLDCLDAADASQLTPVRNVSVTAPQALALLNDDFILVHSQAFARSLEKEAPDRGRQISLACNRVWGRPPTAEEAREFAEYSGKHGLANLCRVLLNSSEFLFVD
jgi:hypothetical protein